MIANELSVLQCLDTWLVALLIATISILLTEIMSGMTVQYILLPVCIELVSAYMYGRLRRAPGPRLSEQARVIYVVLVTINVS